jgi:ABC-type proline/glycine betaine transport system ATPase subunit
MAEALALGDHIGVMEGGRLIWHGTPQAIVECADARVRALVDSVLSFPRPDTRVRPG